MVGRNLKAKLMMFLGMVGFMLLYSVVFGNNNMVIGLTIVMAAFMNLGNDFSFKPKLSFFKLLILFLSLGIVAFLNNPITAFGCILTFLVLFATTFTSYHLFSDDTYLPYLMLYFMMMCIPVSLQELPMRLLSLAFGALFIVGLNMMVNKNKSHKLTKQSIKKLSDDILNAIDLKLDGKNILKDNFKVINGFYSSIFSRFEYRYFASPSQESVLNIIKAFQYIGVILSDYDFSEAELNHIKKLLENISNIDISDIYEGFSVDNDAMYWILLNFEIIVTEIKNKDYERDSIIPDKQYLKEMFKPILKRQFSFRSPVFTFAFKMAFVLTLWEVLTLIFNLPYTKWLYFASISMMMPYVNDMVDNGRKRLIGTVIGVIIFTIIVIALPFIPISPEVLMIVVLFVCIFGMIQEMNDKLKMTIFTTVMSVMVSLMYISPQMAIPLKIIWVAVAFGVSMIISYGFLPYSVEKETKNNLNLRFKLNRDYLDLIMQRCVGTNSNKKNTLLVLSNIIGENIDVTDDNKELYELQIKVTDISNFILTCIGLFDFSEKTLNKIMAVIDGQESFDDDFDIKESILLFSTLHLVKLFNKEKDLINNLF